MSKILYVFEPHSIVDIITNSSSELFVFKGKSKKIVEGMIKKLYPDYLSEYEELRHIDELTAEDLDSFLGWHCYPCIYPATREDYPLIGDYTFEELYEPRMRNGQPEIAWNDEIQYQLRDNTRPPPKKEKVKKFDDFQKDIDPYGEEDWEDTNEPVEDWHFGSFVTPENLEEVKNRIDPKRKTYFLYSIDDNPDWNYQKKFSKIGTRYHLG
jgi:hypothetical protein